MAYSLWRDGEHLGDVVLPLPTAGRHRSIAGVFVPTPAFHDLAAVMQVRQAFLPGQPVFQADLTHTRTPGPVALQRLSDDEARGLPHHQQLVLHDDHGRPMRTRLIALDRLPTPPSGHGDPVADACADAQVPYSGWYLHAAEIADNDAREV